MSVFPIIYKPFFREVSELELYVKKKKNVTYKKVN